MRRLIITFVLTVIFSSCATTAQLYIDPRYKIQPQANRAYPEINVGVKINVGPKIKFNKNIFGNIENDPRLVGTSAVITENKSYIDNGVFTTCKKRGDKCPPWKMSAKK